MLDRNPELREDYYREIKRLCRESVRLVEEGKFDFLCFALEEVMPASEEIKKLMEKEDEGAEPEEIACALLKVVENGLKELDEKGRLEIVKLRLEDFNKEILEGRHKGMENYYPILHAVRISFDLYENTTNPFLLALYGRSITKWERTRYRWHCILLILRSFKDALFTVTRQILSRRTSSPPESSVKTESLFW